MKCLTAVACRSFTIYDICVGTSTSMDGIIIIIVFFFMIARSFEPLQWFMLMFQCSMFRPSSQTSPASSAPSQRRRVKPQRRRASELQLTYVRASLSTANTTAYTLSTNSTLPPANMFARRAVSSVARRAVAARPVVPVRSFASSVRRCEFCLVSLRRGCGREGRAIGEGAEEERRRKG